MCFLSVPRRKHENNEYYSLEKEKKKEEKEEDEGFTWKKSFSRDTENSGDGQLINWLDSSVCVK